MFTKNDLNKYIADYIAACNELGLHFEKVILFGSYARNAAHKWSDIDLALVSDDFTGMRLDDREKTSRADLKFVNIESHLFNTAYFETGDPFVEEIKKTGREISVGN
jgi:uncharacterized protein